jgi:hypothetical protein
MVSATLSEEAHMFAPVFAPDAPVTVVCDDPAAADTIRAAGWPDVRSVSSIDTWAEPAPSQVVFVCSDPASSHDSRLSSVLFNSHIIYVPLHAFDPSPRAALYTLQRLASADFRGAVKRNRHWVHVLERTHTLRFASRHHCNAVLTCTPAEDIYVGTLTSTKTAPGDLVPFACFFEVELEGFRDERRPFQVSGTFHADCVCYACSEDFVGDRSSSYVFADRLLRAAQFGGLDFRVENNFVLSCTDVAGTSLLNDLREAVGGSLELTEFAIGTNPFSNIDASVNAQINEGAGGIHIGLGDGDNILHIDFVSTAARLLSDDE